MTVELGRIITFVDQLSEANTDGVEPMAHALDLANVLRDDTLAPSLPREDALSNAPHHDGRGYLVPAKGAVEVNGVRLDARDGAAIRDVANIRVTAIDDAELVFVDAA